MREEHHGLSPKERARKGQLLEKKGGDKLYVDTRLAIWERSKKSETEKNMDLPQSNKDEAAGTQQTTYITDQLPVYQWVPPEHNTKMQIWIAPLEFEEAGE